MNQQRETAEAPTIANGGTIPIRAEYDARAAQYRLHSLRATLPVTNIDAFGEGKRTYPKSLTLYTALYSRLGRLGPFVIRLLHILLNRILRFNVIPADVVAIARYPVLFDSAYYLEQIAQTSHRLPSDPLAHYLQIGDAHNICPNPLFDPAMYRRYNMLPSETTQNTLAHYIAGEWHGTGVTSYLFNSRWYMAQNSDVNQTGINPLAHYLSTGFLEHRDPSPVMHVGNYWARTPSITTRVDPATHYVRGGYKRYPHADEMVNILTDMPFPYDVSREFQHFATHAVIPYNATELAQHAAYIRTLIAACPAINTDTPRVSIIIPVFNQLKYTITAVQSVLLSATTVPFELVIMDDCSSDETAAFFAHLEPIRCFTQPHNQGFIAACNQGATLARGEFVSFLNNDVYVFPLWLDALVDTFERIPNVGLVGSQLLYPDGFLQEAGGIIWQNGQGWNYGRGEYPMLPEYTYARSVDYCSGASILIRKELFVRLGMFPEAFKPAYYEDADLAMAVRAAGYDVIYQPGSKLVHFEGVSSGRDVGSGVKAYQIRNHAFFAEKWQAQLAPRRPYGDNPPQVAEYGRTGRILFADATYPTPDQDAGSAVADGWMRIFVSLGYHVTFIGLDNFIAAPKYTKRLEQMGVYCPRRPYHETLTDFLATQVNAYDLNVVIRYDRAHRLYTILDTLGDTRPRIFMPCDLHYLRELRRAELDQSMPALLQSFKTKYEEYSVMAEASLICVHSQLERDEIVATVPSLPVAVTPIMYDVPGRTTGFAGRQDILFVGGFRHPPNVDGMLFFVNDVWPLVKHVLPELVLHVVGSNITPEIAALAAPSVRIHGFVEDLTPMLNTVRLTIAPLRYGAGVKGKVTMSMCNGIPVVGTSVAFEGMALENGTEILCGDTAEALAAHIIAAYRDEALWYRLSDGAVARAQREYSIASNIPQLTEFISVVTTPNPRDQR